MKEKWGTKVEIERRRRIVISVWAYAYEFENDSLVSDKEFDDECMKVDESISTGNKKFDKFLFPVEIDSTRLQECGFINILRLIV